MGRAHDEADRLIDAGAGRKNLVTGLQEFEGRAVIKNDADQQEVRDDVGRLLHYMSWNGVPDGANDRDREVFVRFDALPEDDLDDDRPGSAVDE